MCLFPLLNLVLRILSNCYYCRVYFTLAIMMLFVHPMCVYATCYTPGIEKIVPRNIIYTPGIGKIVPRNIINPI